MWYANVVANLAVLLLGIGLAATAWLSLPYMSDFSPGPGFVPFWLGVVLVVAAVPSLIADARQTARDEQLFRPETWRCLQVLALVVAVFLLVPVLGFPIGLAAITVCSMRLMGKHGWVGCLLTGVGTAVAIHFVFGRWLSIPLPGGLLGW